MIPHDPLPASAGLCRVIPGFLSAAECREHIALSEARGFAGAGSHYPPSYRNNARQVVDDPALAARLLERLRAHLPATLEVGGETWALDGLNERLRFCRYEPGQAFGLHQDGVHHRGPGLRSHLTFMVYLTDGDLFEGGDTLFLSAGPAGEADGSPARPLGRVRPRAGSLILFDHRLWHAGEAVTRGVKHILRSDVLYRRVVEGRVAPARPFEPGHQGYVWTLVRLGRDLIASGGRDTRIRLWRDDGTAVGELAGHRQSVLGLAALAGGGLASVSRDGTLRAWDVAARRGSWVAEAHAGSALSVAALHDGTLATGGADGLVRLWQADGTPVATLDGHGGWVWSVAELADGTLASASEDGSVKLWREGRCTHTLQGASPLRDLAVLEASHIACGDLDGVVTTWARGAEGWSPSVTLQAHRAAVRRLRLLAPGLLASAGEDHRVRVWQLSDRACVAEATHDNFATDVLAVPGGLLSCAYDGRMLRHPLP